MSVKIENFDNMRLFCAKVLSEQIYVVNFLGLMITCHHDSSKTLAK